MSLAEIVVDQLVFVLGAPDEVLDPDSAVGALQGALSRLAELPEAELAPVRQAAANRLAGEQSADAEDALRELVLLLSEIDAA